MMYAKILKVPNVYPYQVRSMSRFIGKIGVVIETNTQKKVRFVMILFKTDIFGYWFRKRDVKLAKTKKELLNVKPKSTKKPTGTSQRGKKSDRKSAKNN